MFNGILKSDDVEVYEVVSNTNALFALTDSCKSNIIVNIVDTATSMQLPASAYIGKIINITVLVYSSGTGKAISNANALLRIQHSNTTLFTLRQGTVSFMYVGQQLNGLTATDKAKSGWIILGGVQGDTAITGYVGSDVSGSGAYASGTGATVKGQSATSAQDGTAIGNGANSPQDGVIVGRSANGAVRYSAAYGFSSYSATAKVSFKSNPQFSASGDAQAGKFILMRQTTDATPLVLSATNAAASTTNILILPNNGTYAFKGIVVAKDATTLDSAMWEVTALMKRGANASTTALVGTPTITKVFNDAGAAAWTIALTADTTNGGGAITVTGEAGKTIRWVSDINSCEVI